MTRKSLLCSVLAISFLLTSYANRSAISAPNCKNSFQLINGQWIGTPYCGDKWLADISGTPLSVIRDDPTERRRVCLMFRTDVMVTSVCGIDADLLGPDRSD